MSERKFRIVRPVPTKAPKMPDGRDLPVMSKEEVDAFFGAILGGLRKARLRRENARKAAGS